VVQDELRIYTVQPGKMQAWLREWKAQIRPLREKFGFQILGAWIAEADNQFLWILRYVGPESFASANAAYYESPERKAIAPDPARHLAKTEHRLMTPVD
jgi:NIPSNAP